jgi:DNA ligase 1
MRSYNPKYFVEGEIIKVYQKLNGVYARYYNGTFSTRNYNEICGLEHIKVKGDNVEGELLYCDPTLSDMENFQICAGIINSKQDRKPEIKFVPFDDIPYTQVEFSEIGIEEILEEAVKRDWEGLVIQKEDGTKFKLKRFETLDLKIVGFVEGTGRNKGRLGAIQVDYEGNTVNVGSGFTDSKREHIWIDKPLYLGRLAEIKYKSKTKNKNGGYSLQFPTFVCFRWDKDEYVSWQDVRRGN